MAALSPPDDLMPHSGPPQDLVSRETSAAKPSFAQRFARRLHDAVFASPAERAPAGDVPETVERMVSAYPSEVAKEFGASARQMQRDLLPGSVEDLRNQSPLLPGVSELADAAGMALSPVTGAANALGIPLESATGVRREIPGAILTAVIPGVGEEKAVAGSASISKAIEKLAGSSDPAHLKAVQLLQGEGVKLTPWQIRGGDALHAGEAWKSNPYVGKAFRDAGEQAQHSMNRAIYNRVLKPVGEKVKDTVAAGHEAVKDIGNRLSKRYDALKPQMRLVPDDQLISDLAETRGTGWRMAPAQEGQLEVFINDRVLKRLGPEGSMDGETFKQVESELSQFSSVYKSSADASQRELGNALEEVNGALRDNMARTSDPTVSEELKRLNTGWAMLRRVESAASNRAGSEGVFNTNDLLSAIKRADRSTGKRAFARGDAMLQDIAEAAHKVMHQPFGTSGTAERTMWNDPKSGLINTAVRSVANPVAKRVIERSVEPRRPTGIMRGVRQYSPMAAAVEDLQSGN